MNMLPILVDVRNAYEGRDRDLLDRSLQRLQARLIAADLMATARTPIQHQDPVSLQRTREDLETKLRAVVAEQDGRQAAARANAGY